MLEHELYTIILIADKVARIRLNPESGIFKAHFPENPVTPGVCQVGIIGEIAGKISGGSLALREVKTLKYTDILRPESSDVEVIFDKLEEAGGEVAAKGTVVSNGKVFTKFSLIFGKE